MSVAGSVQYTIDPSVQKMKKLLLILLMILAGATLSLAFPHASFWLIAWMGLTPLLIIARDSRPMTAALAGLAFGIGFFGALVRWVVVFGYMPWVLLTLKEALPIALFGALACIAYRSRRQWIVLLAVPALWTAIEWLRSLGAYGFPWGYLACSQAQNLPTLQIMSLTGPWGLTFVIALLNTALAAPRGNIAKSLAVAGAVTAVVYSGGYWSMSREEPQREKLAVAVVQGSVHENPAYPKQRLSRIIRAYTELTSEAVRYRPDLVVWPEATVPGDITTNEKASQWVTGLAEASRTHMLVGGPRDVPAAGSKPATYMNSAYMISPGGAILGEYNKVRLAPFGEFVPGRKWIPFIERYCIRDIDIQPGEKHNLLPAAFGKVGVIICFESVFPSIARSETADGANFLCVITREALFKKSSLAAQHHDYAVFRAIETRRFVVRSSATGISSIIDPYGRLQERLGMWERGILYGEIEPRKDLTFYTRFGDWFAYLCCVIAAFGVVLGIVERRKK